MKVTIGLPVFNNEMTVAAAVTSVLRQTYEDWTLLLLDDGSTDSSLDICRHVEDPRVQVLETDGTNRGLASRLNQIAAESSTEILVRMDADDVMHPQRVAKQVAFLLDNPNVDVVGSRSYQINCSDQIVGAFKEPSVPATQVQWFLGCGLTHPTITGRTQWFKNNPYRENLRRAEDLELFARTHDDTNFCKLQEFLHFYRVPDSLSWKSYTDSKAAERAAIKLVLAGRSTRTALLARSYLKQSYAAVNLALKRGEQWQRQRATILTEAEVVNATKILAHAMGAAHG